LINCAILDVFVRLFVNIILKIGIEKWFRGEVSKLYENPRTVIKTLPKRDPIQPHEKKLIFRIV
jgi:nitrogen fixation/metabolism regulation signal transduction histidine kinase